MTALSDLYLLDEGRTLSWLRAMNGGLFQTLGVNLHRPDTWPENPINKILKNEDLWSQFAAMDSINGTSVLRAQVICQQAMWHHGAYGKGPEGDGKAKTLRKLWYAGHKDAIQHISRRLGVWRNGDRMNDTSANGALSQVYSGFVDTRLVTYLDMYVSDGSRSFQVFPRYDRLPSPLRNILVCIEKDAAYEDCVLIAKGIGAAAAVSGGGKMGRAGTEKMVRQAFTNNPNGPTPGDQVTTENPLYIVTISDWDYDGEAVIAPTFGNQISRYVDESLINSVRVGIRPAQVEALGYRPEDKFYQVKFDTNSAYTSWCRTHALFAANGDVYRNLIDLWDRDPYAYDNAHPAFMTEEQRLPPDQYDHKALKAIFQNLPPMGFELDALKRVEYATIMVEGLLQMIPWDTLLEALSKKAWSNDHDVTEMLVKDILDDNEDYSELDKHIGDLRDQFEELIAGLEERESEFRNDIWQQVYELVKQYNEDDRIKGDDPEPTEEEFAGHLRQTQIWEHWQPYKKADRDKCHEDVVKEEEEEALQELKGLSLEFDKVSFSSDSDDDS